MSVYPSLRQWPSLWQRAHFVLLLIGAVCLTIALAGCATEAQAPGQGADASVTPAQPEEQEAKVEPGATLTIEDDGRPVLVAFGDSLTAGFGLASNYSYPAYLQKLLDTNGFSFRVVNAGISGDTTANGLTRLANVIDMKPAIVILELGGNDGLRGLTVQQTRQNLAVITEGLVQAETRVVIAGITLPRNYGQDYIRDFETIYGDLAARYKLPYVPFLLEGVAVTPPSEELMQEDGIHPTPVGNQIVAKNVFAVLEPVLRELDGRPDPAKPAPPTSAQPISGDPLRPDPSRTERR